jgi:hypothetical protein
VGAVDFLEIFDLVDDIMMKTRFTETEFMLTVAHEDLFVFLCGPMDFSLANFTYHHIANFLDGFEETAAHHVANCRCFHLFFLD